MLLGRMEKNILSEIMILMVILELRREETFMNLRATMKEAIL
jgi:hypothetical protein